MKNKSYFLLSREIFDSAIWRDDPHILKLFLYLIGQARFDDKPKKYPTFEIKKGEMVSSLSQIAENNEYMWHGSLHQWSRQKVSRMLEVLTCQGYINLLADTYGTHVKVCNYERYQEQENYKRTEVEQKWNRSGTEVGINKHDKQDKQEKQEKPPWKLSSDINEKAWEEFEQHRKDIKKPMTDLARTKATNVLKIHSSDIQQKMIDKSILGGWPGLYSLGKENHQPIAKPPKEFSGFTQTDAEHKSSMEAKEAAKAEHKYLG